VTAATKEIHELAVYREFAIAASLQWPLECAEARRPPEPDIFVAYADQSRYFELGRLADAEHARTILKALRESPRPVKPNVSKIKLPEREVLRRKLAKTYITNGYPLDLLLYFDAEEFHLLGGLPPMEFCEHAKFAMLPLLQLSMGPFQRVWVFERYRRTVLWQYPFPKAEGG
jgi:hypothetical protein